MFRCWSLSVLPLAAIGPRARIPLKSGAVRSVSDGFMGGALAQGEAKQTGNNVCHSIHLLPTTHSSPPWTPVGIRHVLNIEVFSCFRYPTHHVHLIHSISALDSKNDRVATSEAKGRTWPFLEWSTGEGMYRSTEISEVYLRAFLESWTSRLQDTPILNNRIIGTSVHLGCHRRESGCTEVLNILLFKIGLSWNRELGTSVHLG